MIISDCHMHTSFSSDCKIPPKEQIERAIALGLKYITITDHHDYDAITPEGTTFLLDLENYFPALATLKEEYASQIQILTGIELGLQKHIQDYLVNLVATYTEHLDFLIGSSHFIDGIDVYYKDYFYGREEYESYHRYFEVTLDRIETMDTFDSFGHLDYVVRYGPNKNTYYHYKEYANIIDAILSALIKKEKALEVNSAGFKYGLGTSNPSFDVIKRYQELGGILLTIGSDAHQPQFIGYEFDKVREMLLLAGFKSYYIYQKRKPVEISLQ